MISTDDAQIQLLINDIDVVNDLIEKLIEMKTHKFLSKVAKYELGTSVEKEKQL